MNKADVVECVIETKDGTQYNIDEYFKSNEEKKLWINKIESKVLSDYYKKKIRIT